MDTPQRTQSRIPTFASIEEEAEFWDTHDSAEFEDEFEEVDLEVARPLHHLLTVRVDSAQFRQLCRLGRERGVGPVGLAQRWLEEALERATADTPPDDGRDPDE